MPFSLNDSLFFKKYLEGMACEYFGLRDLNIKRGSASI